MAGCTRPFSASIISGAFVRSSEYALLDGAAALIGAGANSWSIHLHHRWSPVRLHLMAPLWPSVKQTGNADGAHCHHLWLRQRKPDKMLLARGAGMQQRTLTILSWPGKKLQLNGKNAPGTSKMYGSPVDRAEAMQIKSLSTARWHCGQGQTLYQRVQGPHKKPLGKAVCAQVTPIKHWLHFHGK